VWLYSNLRLAKRTQPLEQQDMAQPRVVLSGEEKEEKEEEGSCSGRTSVVRVKYIYIKYCEFPLRLMQKHSETEQECVPEQGCGCQPPPLYSQI